MSSRQRRLGIRHKGIKPKLEVLEDRLVPSCTFKIVDLDGNHTPDLQIIGDKLNQKLTIIDDPDANRFTISLDCNGNNLFTDPGDLNGVVFASAFQIIDVRLGGGDDRFEYHSISPYNAPLGSDRDLRVDLGSGNDLATVTMDGDVTAGSDVEMKLTLGPGANTLNATLNGSPEVADPQRLDVVSDGGRLAMNIQGGDDAKGADLVSVNLNGRVLDGVLDVSAALLAGNDQFIETTDLKHFDEPQLIVTDLAGAAGFGHATFDNGELHVGVVAAPNTTYTVKVDTVEIGDFSTDGTGSGFTDVTKPKQAPQPGSIVSIVDQAGNVVLTGTAAALPGGVLGFSVDGGAGNDILTATRGDTRNTTPPEPLRVVDGTLAFDFRGGAGNDLMTIDYGSLVPFPGDTDAEGALRLGPNSLVQVNMDGGSGNDTEFLNLRNSAASSGTYNASLAGGTGNDQLFLGLFDQSFGRVTYVPSTGVQIDGGAGTDDCFTSPGQNGMHADSNCETSTPPAAAKQPGRAHRGHPKTTATGTALWALLNRLRG